MPIAIAAFFRLLRWPGWGALAAVLAGAGLVALAALRPEVPGGSAWIWAGVAARCVAGGSGVAARAPS